MNTAPSVTNIYTPSTTADYRSMAQLPDGRTLVSCCDTVLVADADGDVVGRLVDAFCVGCDDKTKGSTPEVIAVNDEGHMFTVDRQRHCIHEFDKEMKPLAGKPECIAVNSIGQVFVTDSHHNCIHIYDNELKYYDSILTQTPAFSGLNQPIGIAISASDNRIWVADNENHRVLVLSAEGKYMATLGEGYGTAPGHLHYPRGIALFDHPIHGELVIVSEWGNGRVQVFKTTGEVFAIYGGVPHAYHVVVDRRGVIYVCEYDTQRVRRFSLDGDLEQEENAVSLVAGENGLKMVVEKQQLVGLCCDDNDVIVGNKRKNMF